MPHDRWPMADRLAEVLRHADVVRRCFAGSALLFFLAAAPAGAAVEFSGTAARISDGDTLWVRPDDGRAPIRVRLQGLDAPELCQSGGAAARAALAQQLTGRRFRVRVLRRDDWGRLLVRITVEAKDVGAELVRQGQAWSDGWRHHPGPYAAEEAQARSARRGVFAQAAERPREFRRRHGPCQSNGSKP